MKEVMIVVPGLHQDVEQWEHCMWGRPQAGVYGRASYALQLSTQYSQALLFLGGGGVVDERGISVAYATKELIFQRASELFDCSFQKGTCAYQILQERLYVDTSAADTSEEIANAFALCKKRKISRMCIISSPTHIARCLQYALVCKESDGFGITIEAHPSDVNYVDTSADDVVIIEPPHLPGATNIKWHTLIRRMIPFMKDRNRRFAFAEALRKLLDSYEKNSTAQ